MFDPTVDVLSDYTVRVVAHLDARIDQLRAAAGGSGGGLEGSVRRAIANNGATELLKVVTWLVQQDVKRSREVAARLKAQLDKLEGTDGQG